MRALFWIKTMRRMTRVDPWRRVFRMVCLLSLGCAVLYPYAVSIGASGATFTLVNRTPYYLHALINNLPSIYLPPGSVVNYDASGLGAVTVEVRYSPGQVVKGGASKSFVIEYQSTTSGKSSSDCSSSNSNSDCSSSTEASTTVTATPVRWEVTTDDLVPE